MTRPRSASSRTCGALAVLAAGLFSACASGRASNVPITSAGVPDSAFESAFDSAFESAFDSAFAAVEARGADPRGMGVDQATSVHQFDALPDGGRIELQRGIEDPAGVAQVREHLQHIAAAFTSGDFSTPAFVHMQQVPGTREMAEKRALIRYTYRELPRGGEVRITTRDPDAIRAVHAFIAFQRQDHRAGGV